MYMEFRKTVTITLYARQQEGHRCIAQILDSVGEGEGWMIWEHGTETCKIHFNRSILGGSIMRFSHGLRTPMFC